MHDFGLFVVSAHQSIGLPQPLKFFGTDAQKQTYQPRISRLRSNV